MNLPAIQQTLFPLIKVLSIGLMSGAIGLEAWHLSRAMPTELWRHLTVIVWVGRFAIGAHLLEAVIAAIYARRNAKPALSYGFYTFWVGTVGLIELWQQCTTPTKVIDESAG